MGRGKDALRGGTCDASTSDVAPSVAGRPRGRPGRFKFTSLPHDLALYSPHTSRISSQSHAKFEAGSARAALPFSTPFVTGAEPGTDFASRL